MQMRHKDALQLLRPWVARSQPTTPSPASPTTGHQAFPTEAVRGSRASRSVAMGAVEKGCRELRKEWEEPQYPGLDVPPPPRNHQPLTLRRHPFPHLHLAAPCLTLSSSSGLQGV